MKKGTSEKNVITRKTLYRITLYREFTVKAYITFSFKNNFTVNNLLFHNEKCGFGNEGKTIDHLAELYLIIMILESNSKAIQ